MKKRIFRGILLTSLLALAITLAAVLVTVSGQFADERKNEVRTETAYIRYALENASESDRLAYLESVGSVGENRVTLVDAGGKVLYDNLADASELENHLSRPEIAEAERAGEGESIRASTTLGVKSYYYAVRLNGGEVLRVAATMKSVSRVINNTATAITLIIIFAVLLAIAAARLVTRSIIAPFDSIDLESPLGGGVGRGYPELAPLLARMDKQNLRIAEQMRELSERQREFTEITNGMSEALVIFSADKKVLSANRSAELMFENINPRGIGYYELCRDPKYIEAVEKAFGGGTSGARLEKNGRIYRLSANPAGAHSGDGCAAVLFAVDVTESDRSEQVRREFSANVSHELKTPLTSILGYAEIMNNGVAKPEDLRRFSGMIYNEAKRLLSLIEDIIKLSALDEGELHSEFRQTDLCALAESVLNELTDKANGAGVTLSLEGGGVKVNGIENTLREMIFNLCDNAINYNKKGGSVAVRISRENGAPVLTVADSGIGIAPEFQSRIFERFYRIDKSRSKEKGGTGLGLSIVKHGAMLHDADIRLTSTLGKGTEISLIFKPD